MAAATGRLLKHFPRTSSRPAALASQARRLATTVLGSSSSIDTNATWEEEIPEQNKITADAVKKMMERQ